MEQGSSAPHLAETLLDKAHRVHVLDDLSTGSIENIRHLRAEPRFGYTIDSCHDSRLVAELVDEADYVYHLAAAVGVQLIVDSPVRTIETNVHCTEIVLAQASKKRRPVFVASTSEVYGKSSELPFREDGDIVLGATYRGPLGLCLLESSRRVPRARLLEGAQAAHGRRAHVQHRRPATDRPLRDGRPDFVRQALAGDPITVFGSGEQQRCFCHVKDVVRALVDLLQRDDLFGEVLNIGSTEEISILELAEKVKVITGSESEIVLVPYEEAYGEGFEDMHRRVPDISKIERTLGWRPTASLDEILRDVVGYEMSLNPLSPHGASLASP